MFSTARIANKNSQKRGNLLSMSCLLVLACVGGGCSLQYPADNSDFAGKPILMPGTRDYVNRSASFKLTIDDAYLAAEGAAKTKPGTVVDRQPMFVVDRFYAFGDHDGKNYLPLSGVYVNGDSGVWQFVESDSVVSLSPAPHVAKK